MFNSFAYGIITLLGRPFQAILLKLNKTSFRWSFEPPAVEPHNTHKTTPRSLASYRFRLFRFRSPLLTESIIFLLLGLLRCFNSPRFAFTLYEFTHERLRDRSQVAPFGNPRINVRLQLPEAYRSLPRPSSPLSAQSSTDGS